MCPRVTDTLLSWIIISEIFLFLPERQFKFKQKDEMKMFYFQFSPHLSHKLIYMVKDPKTNF